MRGQWIAVTLLAGAALAWPPGGGAEGRLANELGGGHDRGPRGAGPAFRYGYDRGWREGSEKGHRDGRRCREARSSRDDALRDAGRGYRTWMGPRQDYVAGFRQGHESGYRRAYAAACPGWRNAVRDRTDERRPRDGGHRP
jgi:hypothetical protein